MSHSFLRSRVISQVIRFTCRERDGREFLYVRASYLPFKLATVVSLELGAVLSGNFTPCTNSAKILEFPCTPSVRDAHLSLQEGQADGN